MDDIETIETIEVNDKDNLSEEERATIMGAPSVEELPEKINAEADEAKKSEKADKDEADKKKSKDKEDDAAKSKEEKADKDKEDTEAAKDKKKAEKIQEEKDADTAKAKGKADSEKSHKKIMDEVGKDEGQENLADFSKVEKGLFYELRASRKRAQNAEARLSSYERDKVKKGLEDKGKDKADIEEDLFADLDEDDFLTKAQVKKALKKAIKPATTISDTYSQTAWVKFWQREAKMGKENYDNVINLYDTIIKGNEKYSKELADAINNGDNPYIIAYDLIKKDSRFESLYIAPEGEKKETKKGEETKEDKESLEKLNRINENSKKKKTSGNAGGGDDPADQYSPAEIQELLNNPEKWAKVSRAKRDEILELYG